MATDPDIPTADRRARYVRDMFGRIADRYDLMNRLMTLGQDRVWQRCVARCTHPAPGRRLLDVGTGTGGILIQAYRIAPNLAGVGVDFTLEMLQAVRWKHAVRPPNWVGGDALALPFADGVFDAVTSGYLLRNVADIRAALAEQVRVLKPGGRLVCLDTSPPPEGWLAPVLRLQFAVMIPLLGWLVAGDAAAYRYLPASTRAFLTPDALAAEMRRAGLLQVAYQRFMLGTIAVHVGVKGAESGD
jgi:demethylmenaquinone methyltransferase/2-methoxy-6-polyprenyl-1,4-benzoquinol methylase